MEEKLIVIFFILVVLVWIFTIIDIARSRFVNPFLNTVFLIIVIIFPLIGLVLYLYFRNKLVTKNKRKFQPNFDRCKEKNRTSRDIQN